MWTMTCENEIVWRHVMPSVDAPEGVGPGAGRTACVMRLRCMSAGKS